MWLAQCGTGLVTFGIPLQVKQHRSMEPKMVIPTSSMKQQHVAFFPYFVWDLIFSLKYYCITKARATVRAGQYIRLIQFI